MTTSIECRRTDARNRERERKENLRFSFSLSSSDSTTIICLKPNGIVSLSVAAAVTILALTAVKIPEDITRKRSFSLSLHLSASSALANVTIKDNRATLYSCHLQSFKYFACWYSNVVLAVVVVVVITANVGSGRARKKWRMTIGDVSRSSNKCIRMCRVLSMRKYHDLSCTWSLESFIHLSVIFFYAVFSLTHVTIETHRTYFKLKCGRWSSESLFFTSDSRLAYLVWHARVRTIKTKKKSNDIPDASSNTTRRRKSKCEYICVCVCTTSEVSTRKNDSNV